MAEGVGEDYLVTFADQVNCRGKLTGVDVFGEKTRQLFVARDHRSDFRVLCSAFRLHLQ